MPLTIKCPKCTKLLQVADNLLGKSVRCPCGKALLVQTPAPAKDEPKPAQGAQQTVALTCPNCKVKVRAPQAAIGRSIPCPKCKTAFTTGRPERPAGKPSVLVRNGNQPARPDSPDKPGKGSSTYVKVIIFCACIGLLLFGGAWLALTQGWIPGIEKKDGPKVTVEVNGKDIIPNPQDKKTDDKKPDDKKPDDKKGEDPKPIKPIEISPERVAAEKAAIPVLRAIPFTFDPKPDQLTRLAPSSPLLGGTIAFSPTENALAIGGKDRILFWDLSTGKEIRSLPGFPFDGAGNPLAISPNGKLIACGGSDKQVRVRDVQTGAEVGTLPCGNIPILLTFSADGSTLSAVLVPIHGSYQASLHIWKTSDWKGTSIPVSTTDYAYWAFSPSGNWFAYVGRFVPGSKGFDGSIDLYKLVSGEKKTLKKKLKFGGVVAFTPDDRTLLVGTRPEADVLDRTELMTIDLETEASKKIAEIDIAGALQVTPDGRYCLLQSSGVGGSRLIELATGKERWSGPALFDRTVFSPGGQLMARAAGSNVDLWAVDEMLCAKWAEQGPALTLARQGGWNVSCYNDQVIVAPARGVPSAAWVAGLARSLPIVTHINFRMQSGGSDPAVYAALKDLRELAEIDLSGSFNLTDDPVAALKEVKSLRRLNLSSCSKLTDKAMEAIRGLENLEELTLSGPKDIKDLSVLAGLKKMRVLKMEGMAGLTDESVSHIAGLTELRHLWIVNYGQQKLSSEGFKHFKDLTKLEVLNYSGTLKDDDLSILVGMTNMRELSLVRVGITDAGMAHVKGLTRMRSLRIMYNPGITSAGCAHLQGMTELVNLQIAGTGVTDEGMAHFKNCKKLATVSLSSTKIGDAGLESLAGMTNLHYLDLSDVPLRGPGLRHLKGLKKLTSLPLRTSQIDDAGFEAIAELTQLKTFSLPQNVTDAGLVHLAALRDLEELDLSNHRKVMGQGLRHLKDLPSLRRIRANGSSLADLSGVKELKQIDQLLLGGTPLTASEVAHLEGLPNLATLLLPQSPTITPAVLDSLKKKLPQTSIRQGSF